MTEVTHVAVGSEWKVVVIASLTDPVARSDLRLFGGWFCTILNTSRWLKLLVARATRSTAKTAWNRGGLGVWNIGALHLIAIEFTCRRIQIILRVSCTRLRHWVLLLVQVLVALFATVHQFDNLLSLSIFLQFEGVRLLLVALEWNGSSQWGTAYVLALGFEEMVRLPSKVHVGLGFLAPIALFAPLEVIVLALRALPPTVRELKCTSTQLTLLQIRMTFIHTVF